MRISAEGLKVMHYFESCKLEAYPDPGSADGRPWTIGWGHTGNEVVKGLKWTQEQADSQLVSDLAIREAAISKLVKVSMTQGQFDALVAFQYNTGSLGTSTLLALLNTADYAGAQGQFKRWNKNDGKVMRGLTRRRTAEEALFIGKSGDEAIKIGVSAA